MDVIWARGWQSVAVADVLGVLVKRREIAYTTVMTTLVRLHEKGILERTLQGKRYLYTPVLSRQEFLQTTAREVLENLGASGVKESLAMLVQTVSSSDSESLDELERLIRRRREELGS